MTKIRNMPKRLFSEQKTKFFWPQPGNTTVIILASLLF
uniref:Uncharacterized protein n=1 Tax=Anguilla anguilla TaxID=7936 RepID=A0A0E9W4B7_ANGAN